jgi:metal-dependent amidase/aminoacylase/carboxypeptidase family protein
MDRIEKRILEILELNREHIFEIGRDIYKNAESGYKEYRTSARFIEEMRRMWFLKKTM